MQRTSTEHDAVFEIEKHLGHDLDPREIVEIWNGETAAVVHTDRRVYIVRWCTDGAEVFDAE